MNLSHQFLVTPSGHGMRLDKFLVSQLPSLSRTRIGELIETGQVRINDHVSLTSSFKVKEGQQIIIHIPPLQDPSPLPENIPLVILYEDADVIVINKPAGLVVHPAPGHSTGTLVNALLHHCGDSLSGINGIKRPGIVHRLDKETSGILAIAKNDHAHRHLASQLSDHTMHRAYQAVVWGVPFPPAGTLEGPIGRDPSNRQRMALRQNGKFARTHYKVLENLGKLASLVECRLETGRTHQIRVHFTAKGYPLIGDSVYKKPIQIMPQEVKTYLESTWTKGRQALHAKALSFIHPRTKEALSFSTELPEDMQSLLQLLQQ